MRAALKTFAFLDLISAAFLGMQVFQIITHLDQIPSDWMSVVKAGSMTAIFFSLFVSMTGLWLSKKFGFITYFVQFPFRLLLWVFSLGFITLIPEALSYYGDGWFDVLFKLCIMAEFFRLYFTIRFYRRLFSR